MVEIRDASDALAKALGGGKGERDDIESIHQARLDPEHVPAIIAEPEVVLKALGIKVSEESQVHVTLKRRANRAAAFRRRVVIIIIHWRNCDSDIWIVFF